MFTLCNIFRNCTQIDVRHVPTPIALFLMTGMNAGAGQDITEALSGFQRGTVTGCHLSNKSVHQMYALLDLPRSTVSAVIVKLKRLGATMAQPQSGRPQKLTERDH